MVTGTIWDPDFPKVDIFGQPHVVMHHLLSFHLENRNLKILDIPSRILLQFNVAIEAMAQLKVR